MSIFLVLRLNFLPKKKKSVASSQSTRVEECSLCTILLHHSQVTQRTLCATIVMLPWANRHCSRRLLFSLLGRGSRIDIKLGLIKNRRCVTLLILQGFLPARLQIVSMASNAAQAWLSESRACDLCYGSAGAPRGRMGAVLTVCLPCSVDFKAWIGTVPLWDNQLIETQYRPSLARHRPCRGTLWGRGCC